jgi:hypothetical protein
MHLVDAIQGQLTSQLTGKLASLIGGSEEQTKAVVVVRRVMVVVLVVAAAAWPRGRSAAAYGSPRW